ncbi:hypothetical protein AB8O64_00110 [Streptomyces sp. QH1-20]|uniref:hypothetical protein n=1 Tax=Streptomyces sp. QH1-20 TaxID=3240934 RepID=UPI0035176EFA
MANKTWRLMQGDTSIGELREYAVDQPMFFCRFIPGSGWAPVRIDGNSARLRY